MISSTKPDRSNGRRCDRNGRQHAADRIVAEVLQVLQRSLATSLGNGCATRMEGRSPARWEDEEYTYIEVQLPRILGLDIDLNVHRDRVLIRIGG